MIDGDKGQPPISHTNFAIGNETQPVATLSAIGAMAIILIGSVKTNNGDDYHIEHLGNFIKFLMKLGVVHQIQHFAIAFSKAQYDHPNAIACKRFIPYTLCLCKIEKSNLPTFEFWTKRDD